MVFEYIGNIIDGYGNRVSNDKEMIDKQMVEILKPLLLQESLSCNRCNSIAIPIYGTVNKYKCTGCGRQFSNTKHNIESKLLGYDMRNAEFNDPRGFIDMLGGPSRTQIKNRNLRKYYDLCVNEISRGD